MQQRRQRLGDILDDYCPRERRITNHAVVAMIDDRVQQTRCTTCDAEHEYKEGKAPSLRRRKVADAADEDAGQGGARANADSDIPAMSADAASFAITAPDQEASAPSDAGKDADEGEPDFDDEGPVHRPLIRATLPRTEGQTPERKATDFTVRQPGARDFGHNQGHHSRNHRSGRAGHGGQQPGGQQAGRFGGSRQGGGQGAQDNRGNRAGAGGQGPRGNRSGGFSGPRPPGGGQGRKRGR